MKCAIPGSHVKVFGRAIHALARISDELWFDPTEKGLALRSVNSSRSAYACVFFSCMFFQHYSRVTIHEPGQGDVQLHFKCKFPMKSVLPVFRCLTTLERNVEKCNIYTNFNACHVVFQLFCKHGITKTHNLTFQDCEPLQAVFAKHLCPNILKIQSRVLADLMIHFPAYQEEITLAVCPLKVCFKSYAEEVIDFTKTVHTEIQLGPDEFDYFQIGVDSEVTFCLKELRGFLAFAEATSAYISIHFGMSGKFSLKTISATTEENSNYLADKENHTETAKSSGSLYQSGRQSDNELATIDLNRPLPKIPSENKLISEEEANRVEEVVPSTVGYYKFCSLFFGAVSAKQQDDFNQTLCSLATASDNEEEYFNSGQLSQTF
ncbi:cell cycle checkpoint control protein RAD9B isoform X2 [Rhinatrema bivittatum]|uniref:cell cycle checkpoint control protein RAD9B isoform X2 n=1 Tax=Rhinatrema bivittatum TaxID=194408 RepID=UPI00112C5EAA|nr:cell cycle checkpoint control protein RAD9B isoform X2 [Rhinatrema bivittatum]